MKLLSETYKELGIAFSFPIEIMEANDRVTYFEDCDGFCRKYEYDTNGEQTYYEDSDGYWCKYEYDANGKQTYHGNSTGYWCKYEYNADGNETYYEDSKGVKKGTPKSSKTCEGKVIEVDGIKYKLKAL
jgi:hypothetical protein